jgi:cobalt/nickel transport system ATP-binding protein
MPVIEVSDLTVSYAGGINCLENLSFTVDEGESLAVVGANGAGKTSLLLTLAGITNIKSGEIYIDGIKLSPKTIKQVRQLVGLIFQNPDDQLFMGTVYEDISFGLLSMGVNEKEVQRRVEKIMDELNIAHLKNRPIHHLSGGEKRSIALAGVLVMEPKIMLFDEPSSFLDPRGKRLLVEMLAKLPHTKIIATHDPDLVSKSSSRLLALLDGKAVKIANPGSWLEELFN